MKLRCLWRMKPRAISHSSQPASTRRSKLTSGWTVRGKKLTLVPILRAGLGMVEGILRLIPSARVGHIGLYRDHDTLEPVDYYFKVPGDAAERDFLLLDPMLATGGSAAAAVDLAQTRGRNSHSFSLSRRGA